MTEHWTPGRKGAPRGTQEWADAVRLHAGCEVRDLGEKESAFLRCLEVFAESRAWSLLTKRDGSTFRSRDEYCAYPLPWGLGRAWPTLRPYVVAGLTYRGKTASQIDEYLALDDHEWSERFAREFEGTEAENAAARERWVAGQAERDRILDERIAEYDRRKAAQAAARAEKRAAKRGAL